MTTQNLGKNFYASTFKRSTAAMIDVCIVMIIRIVVLQILGVILVTKLVAQFTVDFQNKFGKGAKLEAIPEHGQFFIHHPLFYSLIISYVLLILVGTLYHSLLNSSSWQATIGKRLLKIMIVNEKDGSKISFWKAISHYFLSALPIVYVIYLSIFQASLKMSSLYEAITANIFNVVIGVCLVIWVQLQIISKRKVTVYDTICNTVFINGRTDFKYPILEFQLKSYAKKL